MNKTTIHIILDKSGSMHTCLLDTIGGFNAFVQKQRELKIDLAFLSLYQFNQDYQITYQNKKIDEVEDLNTSIFQPYGQTALLDAIGKTINSIESNEDDKVIVVIITDGEENSSMEFNKQKINEMISEKKEKGWEFVFLGANQDAIQEAGKLGIGADSSLTYSTDVAKQAFTSLSCAISRSRSTPQKEAKILFTPEERTKSVGLIEK